MEPSHYRYMEGNSLAPCCCLAFQHSSSWTDFCRLSQRSLTSPAHQWEGASCAQKAPKVQMCPGSTVSLLLPPVAYRVWCGCLSPRYFLLRPSLLFPSLNSTHFLWCHIHLICSPALCFKKKKKKSRLFLCFFSRKEYTQFLNEIFYMDVRICGACAVNVAVHLNLQCSHLPPSVLPFIPGRPPG